jgi:hypothetical protein
MDAFPESEPVEAQEHPTQNCAALLQFKCRDSQFIVISNENFRLPSAWPNPPRPAVSAVARAHEGPRLGMPQQNGLSQSIRFSLVRKATAGPGSRIYHPTLICLECRDDHRRITPEGGSQTSLVTTRGFSIQQVPASDIVTPHLDPLYYPYSVRPGASFLNGQSKEAQERVKILLLNIPSYPAEIKERHKRKRRPT